MTRQTSLDQALRVATLDERRVQAVHAYLAASAWVQAWIKAAFIGDPDLRAQTEAQIRRAEQAARHA